MSNYHYLQFQYDESTTAGNIISVFVKTSRFMADGGSAGTSVEGGKYSGEGAGIVIANVRYARYCSYKTNTKVNFGRCCKVNASGTKNGSLIPRTIYGFNLS